MHICKIFCTFAAQNKLREEVSEIRYMSNPTINNMPNLEEYIRQGEPMQRERGQIWQTAIGLQQVDGLNTSAYLLQTAKQRNICKQLMVLP